MNAVTDAVAYAVEVALAGWSGRGRIYVGYSGGMDSSVLLHAANQHQPGGVIALHVNHGLQPQAQAWDAHCQSQCDALGVPLRRHAAAVSPRGNLEAAARQARYAFFASELGAGDALLLAHHRDDQLETLLLRLFQGRGFYGMPAQRQLAVDQGAQAELLRPLLGLPRAVLRDYASGVGLQWVEDPSNADLERDRNYLRHRVLVDLRRRWPALDESLLGALGAQQTAEAALLEALGAVGSRLALRRLPTAAEAAVEALRIWLASLGERLPTRAALAEFVSQLGSPPDRQPSLNVGTGTLRRYAAHVYYVPAAPQLAPSYQLGLPGALQLPHGRLTVAPADGAGFVAGAQTVAVDFVANRPGASILLRGHRARVRELLQAASVPPWRRDTYPLLVDADGVAAVPGIAYRDCPVSFPPAPRYACNWSEVAELH